VDLFLIAVIILSAAPYLIAPIRIYRRNRMAPQPTFEPFDAATHPVPAGAADVFAARVAALAAAGFRVVVDLFRTDAAQGTRMRVALMDQAATEGDLMVLVIGVYSTQFARLATSVEVVSRFAGSGSLSVSNSPQPGVFGAVPGRIKERFRMVDDPVRLLRIHESLLARRYATRARESLRYRDDPAGFLADSMTRELRQQVDTGYLWMDQRANVYRPTWKGACLMTWKLVSPVREVREWREQRRARALLRELGLEGLDSPSTGAPPLQRPAPLRWNWVTLLAAVALLLIRPAWLDRAVLPVGTPVPVRLPHDFTVPDGFPDATRVLERLAGAPATPLVVTDSLGRNVRTDAMGVPVEGSRAEQIVAAAQDRFLAKGFYLFRVAQHFGIRDLPDTIALYPTRDPFAVVRLVGTNGANYGIDSDSIITWLKTLQRDQPFILTGVGFDWLEGRFTTPLADADGLARRFNAFCPDIVTQGTGTVAALARELRASSRLYCWWD